MTQKAAFNLGFPGRLHSQVEIGDAVKSGEASKSPNGRKIREIADYCLFLILPFASNFFISHTFHVQYLRIQIKRTCYIF